MKAKEKWYKPATKHTGWTKKDPAHIRRARSLRAHGNNLLAAARAQQALANITQDKETEEKSRMDSKYFFREHRNRQKS
jgi:hypothetical protein